MIIGISGKRGTGKTTAADYLINNFKFSKASFAKEIKDRCKRDWGMTDVELNGELKEVPFRHYKWTPRHMMVEVGKFYRDFDENYWLARTDLTGKRVVLDDLRHVNEAIYLKKTGAKLIRLERFQHLNIYKTPSDDISETALDNYEQFDYVIDKHHNVTKSDLYRQLDKIMKEIL